MQPVGLPCIAWMPPYAEHVVTVFGCEKGIVEPDFGNPWDRATEHILDARLRRPRHGNRIAVATETGVEPEN
jgi:hypothetical protein